MRAYLSALVTALAVCAPAVADARPLHYLLDPAQSEVGFEVSMGQSPLKGRMPVTAADLTLDFDRASASHVSVTLSPAKAEMGLPFATEAMKSPEVLDAGQHPEIHFESTRVIPTADGARIDGRITIRGVTRPVTLQARIFRPEGSEPGARAELTIRLNGTISRSDFGAVGFGDMVGDRVLLDIRAHIRMTG
jgi:polyisoprenoid-binding protein YceI